LRTGEIKECMKKEKETVYDMSLPCGLVGNIVVSRVKGSSTSLKICSAVRVWLNGMPVSRELLRAFRKRLQRGRK
jgi:hypothetical protein